MEKSINVKTKKVNLMFGFINDNNYGVHYPTLVKSFELSQLFPFINQGEVKLDKRYYDHTTVMYNVFYACKELCGPGKKAYDYDYYVEVRTLKYEPTISVSFRIEKAA